MTIEPLQRRLLFPADVLGDRAPIRIDTPSDVGAERGEEARNRLELALLPSSPSTGQAGQEPLGVGMERFFEERVGRTVRHDAARVQDGKSITHLADHGKAVADEQHGHADLAAELRYELEHLGLDRRVEAGGLLIEHEELGPGGNRHRDHYPLQHPSGQLVRIAPHHPGRIGDLNLLEDLDHLVWHFLLRSPHELEHLADLAPDLDRGVERGRRVLIDHRDVVHPHLAELPAAELGHVAAVDPNRAGTDPTVAREVVHDRHRHGGLAAPGLTDEAEGLAAVDGETDVAYRRLPFGADLVFDGKVVDLEYRL